MNLFISWSGDLSKALAKVLREWLPKAIPDLEPFYSPHDIKAGMRWSNELATRLDSTSNGIICLTRDNVVAPWLMFEAGALSKQFDSRVCPLLFGFTVADLQGPLVQFQAKEFGRDSMFAILESLNDRLQANQLPGDELSETFRSSWEELNVKVEEILLDYDNGDNAPPLRSDRDLLEEIMIRLRAHEGRPMAADMVRILVEFTGNLIESSRYIADREKRGVAARALYHLQFPLQHFIRNIPDTGERQELAELYARTITALYAERADVNEEQLVQYLVHSSDGPIIPAPIIPKPDNRPES